MPAILRARHFAVLSLMLAFALVASMFALTPSADAMTKRRAGKFYSAMDIVRNQKGDPYSYGADGPNAFDCSGLIYYSFRKAGFSNIPRTSDQLAGHSRQIRRSKMRKGDFVFFHNGGDVYHVGVFAGWRHGRRYIIHAPYGDERVHRAPIWTNSWFPGSIR
ncbi:MAG: C40 family peptidase [Pseudonocardia sp.]